MSLFKTSINDAIRYTITFYSEPSLFIFFNRTPFNLSNENDVTFFLCFSYQIIMSPWSLRLALTRRKDKRRSERKKTDISRVECGRTASLPCGRVDTNGSRKWKAAFFHVIVPLETSKNSPKSRSLRVSYL